MNTLAFFSAKADGLKETQVGRLKAPERNNAGCPSAPGSQSIDDEKFVSEARSIMFRNLVILSSFLAVEMEGANKHGNDSKPWN